MAKWGRGKNRSFGHVHNWQLRTESAQDSWELSVDPNTGWQGFYINRWWACVRGGEVKHVSPSVDYPLPTGLYGRKWNEGFEAVSDKRVFLALSGYTYHAENSS
jgi:hypothetical protein